MARQVLSLAACAAPEPKAVAWLHTPVTADWQQVIVFIAIASMVLGAFAAIGQTNI